VIAAEEAARAALPLLLEHPADSALAATSQAALEAVAQWQANRLEAHALKRTAEEAYRAAHAVRHHAPGAPGRSAAFAAAHAASAAFFLSAGGNSDPATRRKVFAAARDACQHASIAAAGRWGGEFSAEWAKRWWEKCIPRVWP
jgi:hypothetical protein